jgi:hypothetical protein
MLVKCMIAYDVHNVSDVHDGYHHCDVRDRLNKKDFLVVGKVHDGLGDSDVRGGLDADISVMFEK